MSTQPTDQGAFPEQMGEKLAGWPEPVRRLREEEAAMLPPGDVLPVFEHYGMMPELDRWVVGHVVTQLESKTGFARLSVNSQASP